MASKAVEKKTKQFLKLYGADITNALENTGIFLATAVGQKCNESGYGTSPLARNHNNFGGIRGLPKEAIGKTSNGWAIFKNPADCFKSYARFIREKPQYAKALKATSPEQQILELVRAGYCETGWRTIDGKRTFFTAEDYLKICQGALDTTRNVVPVGVITTSNKSAYLSQLNKNTL